MWVLVYVCVCVCVGGGGSRRGGRACVCVYVCVVSMTVKRPALPPCAIDGQYRNHFEPFYFISFFINNIILPQIGPESA